MDVQRKNGTAIVNVAGRLDGSTNQEFEELMLGLLDEDLQKIVVDFSDLEYINSSGLRVLVMTFQRITKKGGSLAVCGLRDYILEVFTISGYDMLLQVHPTVEDALGG